MKELSRLRARFVLFNMILVSILMAGAMAAGSFLIRKQISSGSSRVLDRVIAQELDGEIFTVPSVLRIPYFSVVVEENGAITLLDGAYNSFPGQAFVEKVAGLGSQAVQESGVLKEYHLRFVRASHPSGMLIAFADTSYEDSLKTGMIQNLAWICGGIWLGLLGLSCLFARLAVKPVETSVLQQKQFVADASHELKTPLTVISANAELLAANGRGISDDMDKWIGNVNQECREMRGLIEELLILARSDLQTPARTRQMRCSLSELTDGEILVFEPVFFQNKRTLLSRIEPDIQVKGDEKQFRKLVRILLDNAVKYSAAGTSTEVVLKKTGKHRASLSVTSCGDPIPRAEQKAIFRRFYRSDAARSLGGGYGLGLAIASEIVRGNRAKIKLETGERTNRFSVIFHI